MFCWQIFCPMPIIQILVLPKYSLGGWSGLSSSSIRKLEVNGGGRVADPPCVVCCWGRRRADPPEVVWGLDECQPTKLYGGWTSVHPPSCTGAGQVSTHRVVRGLTSVNPPSCTGAGRMSTHRVVQELGADECQPTKYELSVRSLGMTKSWVTPHSTQAPNVTWSLPLQVGSRSEVQQG